ncbi:splicing factor-like protein 1 isoform X2 [Amaranthus tricolor]|uniref:splicing factor-like protein 1 isoform X2 n=1 Tax=Amaranthus tricolor TaxID=29722 RepID=UPI00258DB193|nr:splicing factor-like protein 1 isoform X2 [Amaranthus tricolor]
MSMLKGKAGFVIPKNKFSGSLVPIFKGSKKSESNDAVTEESGRQLQRKTKWGPDLSQDASVKKGRVLAYQVDRSHGWRSHWKPFLELFMRLRTETRVDQITEQLKSGSLGSDNQSSKSDRDGPDSELPSMQIEFKLQTLELERREAIGEIMKLNPNYKAPFDYHPVVREAKVPIPVKAHPDYNFLGLVYGSDGETQKRLEKETGTRILVCGTKSETKEKVEITASDGNELLHSCDEVYVQISGDTYEKVDAAAALIELLLNSVKSAASTTLSSSGDNVQGLSGAQDIATSSTSMANQELLPGAGPMSTSSLGPFQSFQSAWLPAGQANTTSGFVPLSGSMAIPFNPSLTRPLLRPGPPAPFGFSSAHQSAPPRLPTSAPDMSGSFMPSPVGQAGHFRNLSGAVPPFPPAGSPRFPTPQLAERPITSSSPGWLVSPTGAQQSLISGSFPIGASQGSIVSRPVGASTTTAFPSQLGPGSLTSFMPSQIRSSSPMSVQPIVLTLQGQLLRPSTNTSLRPTQNPSTHPPSFTPLKHVGPTPSGPTIPGPNDFTFQPLRLHGPSSQSLSGLGLRFASQRPARVALHSAPQGPSFRPPLQISSSQLVRQNLAGPPIGNQMGPRPGQFGSPNPNPRMGPRHFSSVPDVGSSFPPAVGHSPQFQQRFPAPPLRRPGGNFPATMRPAPFGRPQSYDPFAPTSISTAQPQGSNIGIASKQETDPEYEDLMASVGVK